MLFGNTKNTKAGPNSPTGSLSPFYESPKSGNNGIHNSFNANANFMGHYIIHRMSSNLNGIDCGEYPKLLG